MNHGNMQVMGILKSMSVRLVRLSNIAVLSIFLFSCRGGAEDSPQKMEIPEEPKTEEPQNIDWALKPPPINTSPLPDYDNDKLDYGMVIGMDRTPNGTIWACWVGGGDSEKAFFVLATSKDNGETWSKPRLVIDPHSPEIGEARSALVGNVWADPDGRLWVFFSVSMKMFDGRAGSWYIRSDNPDSDNPTWTAPERIWHGFTLNKPTVLSNGEWLLPISIWDRTRISQGYKERYKELDEFRMANVMVSADKGKTWQRRGGVKFPDPEFDEHHITEKKDGTLWITARTKSNGVQESFSPDKGKTWIQPRKSIINHISARHFIRRLQSGNLLLIKHGITVESLSNGRRDLTAFISKDDGKSWEGGLILDERINVSYPDGFQTQAGTIYICYDRERSKLGEILMARFTENDVLNRKFTDKNSKGKMLISKAGAPKS